MFSKCFPKNGLKLILRPVVKCALRHHHSLQSFVDIAKEVFVEVAHEELLKTAKKINVSRLTAVTGLNRKEVKRILDHQEPARDTISTPQKVVGQWQHDPRFTTQRGEPRVLSYEGENNQFKDLVESVSKNINPGTILFELCRMGIAEKGPRGLKLKTHVFNVADNVWEGLRALSNDLDSLICVVEENLLEPQATKNLHIRTEYDNVFQLDLDDLKRWLSQRGNGFHSDTRDKISQSDKDINPQKYSRAEPAGGQIVVTSFARVRQ